MATNPDTRLFITLTSLYTLSFALAILLTTLLNGLFVEDSAVILWNGHHKPAPAFVPLNADEQILDAAELYVDAAEELTGYRPIILKEVPGQDTRGVYFGETHLGKQSRQQLLPPNDEERWFAMQAKGASLLLWGSDSAMVEHGLTRYFWKLGYRNYAPGSIGLVYEPLPELHFPIGEPTLYIPQMQSRAVTGRWKGIEEKWSSRLWHRRYHRFSHNMFTVVKPQLYDEHPEWFPRVSGEFKRPSGRLSYQPDLEHPGVINNTLDLVRDTFKRDPNYRMFSLGLNDNFRFGAQVWDSPKLDKEKFFRGRLDFSDYVFHYYNQIAESLYEEFPDRKLGVLSYSWWQNYPSFPVHEMIFPYICEDRTLWFDENRRDVGIELLRKFSDNGKRPIGIYDYNYGDAASYTIPRVYLNQHKALFELALRYNIRGYHAELFPVWGFDLPKAALIQELCFMEKGEAIDGEDALDEFYQRFYGKAAPAMRDYFDYCELLWQRIDGDLFWLKYFKNETQLELIEDADFASIMRILKQAHTLAEGKQKARVDLSIQLFNKESLLRKAWNLYQMKKALLHRPDKLREYQQLRDQLQEDYNTFEPKPYHEGYDRGLQFHLTTDPSMRWLRYEPIGENLLKNSSFETTTLPPEDNPFATNVSWKHWHSNRQPSEGFTMEPTTEAYLDGALGVSVKGSARTGVYQHIRIVPYQHYRLELQVMGTISPSSSITIYLNWHDAKGNSIGYSEVAMLYPGRYSDWLPLVVIDKAPENAVWATANLMVANQNSGDQLVVDNFTIHAVTLP